MNMITSQEFISDNILNISSVEDVTINSIENNNNYLKINTINIDTFSLNVIFIDQYIKLITAIFEYSNLVIY